MPRGFWRCRKTLVKRWNNMYRVPETYSEEAGIHPNQPFKVICEFKYTMLYIRIRVSVFRCQVSGSALKIPDTFAIGLRSRLALAWYILFNKSPKD